MDKKMSSICRIDGLILDYLARRTKMRTSLPDYDSGYGCSTGQAGISGPLVYLELVLKFTPTVNPVDAGAVMLNTILENFTNSREESSGLVKRYPVRNLARMEMRQVEGFIGIDIPHSGQKVLVK